MVFTIVLITIIVALYGLDFYMKKISRFGRLLEEIPGPKGKPVIGLLLDFVSKSPVQLFYVHREWYSKFKEIYKVRSLSFGGVIINDPNDIEIILSSKKHIKKNFSYDLFHPWLGDGLLMSYGAKWQKRRKLLTPAFHFSILKDACKTFQEQSTVFVESLKSKIHSDVDILLPVSEYTLYSMTESAMGQKIEGGSGKLLEYKKRVFEMGRYFIYRVARIYLVSDFLFGLCKVGSLQKEAIKDLHKFTQNVIKERKLNGATVNVNNGNIEQLNGDSDKSSKRLAMLDLMLAMEKKGEIDDQGIQEEVDTFMFEGHDTTSSGITFLLMSLANHPQVQDRIVEELRNMFDSPDDKAKLEDLNKMTYLECCVKESLRLYPSVHTFSRELTEDVQITNYLLPKGASITIHPFDVHRDPNYFPNPSKFDPERFLPENSVGRHPFCYIPFSAGPRNCIGQKFAMYEMKSIIVSILRKYEVLPVTKPKDVVFTMDIILKARDPVKVKFVPRENPF